MALHLMGFPSVADMLLRSLLTYFRDIVLLVSLIRLPIDLILLCNGLFPAVVRLLSFRLSGHHLPKRRHHEVVRWQCGTKHRQ